MESAIQDNLVKLRQTIGAACLAHGRKADSVTLIAVSKNQPDDAVAAALAAGQRFFGENRVQDAGVRWTLLRKIHPDLRLHMIGSLQSNKAREAIALFDVIETLDRLSLAQALADEMKRQHRHVPCLIQVNTGAEAQKSGVSVAALPDLLTASTSFGLSVTGLMCIPPVGQPPALHFALLKKLAHRHGLHDLSMGMSADFKTAISLGATAVRLGTAIFGSRT